MPEEALDRAHELCLPCPSCDKSPSIAACSGWWEIICNDCYDGAPDTKIKLGAFGPELQDAIEDWNLQCDWYHDCYANSEKGTPYDDE